ncbi:MAG TPA: TonB family protein [Vicinamibacteria bacterium]|nr:TonB family protein [Vicinamibacteria bacterium]
MPKELLGQLVESSSSGISRRSVKIKLLSAGIEAAVIIALIVIPLLATDSLPIPANTVITFMAPSVPPPPPPPPPPASAPAPARETPAKTVTAPRPIPTTDFLAPVELPDEIITEAETETGLLLAGTESEGVPGGALDGVVGGIPGAPAAEPIRVGGEIAPPKKLKDVRPEYPTTARAARVEGVVILEAVIDSRGVVTDVRVLQSVPLLDEAAVEAVKQWRYEATRLNGISVPVVMTVTLNFGLA